MHLSSLFKSPILIQVWKGGLRDDGLGRLEVHVFIGHCASTRSFSGSRPVELIVDAEGTVN